MSSTNLHHIAQELTTAATAYAPLPGTDPVLYTQNAYTTAWLAQIAKANHAVLSKFVVSKDYNLPVSLPSDATLARLAEVGARDPETSWQFFQALWNELTLPGRPPILFALDGLNHIMKLSDYRNKDFELIHSHDLAIVNLFVDYLSGAKTFPNGGALLAATTKGNAPPVSYAMKLALQQQEEKAAGQELTKPDPWTNLDKRSYNSLQKAEVLKLDGLTKPEARGLMEYWAASGVLRAAVTEKMVAEKWTLAGHGVIGEIERGALRMRI
jgi:small subunit ribosomal protein S29